MADVFDYEAIFGADFSVIRAGLEAMPDNVEGMLLGVMDSMVFNVDNFATNLEQTVAQLTANGVKSETILSTLKSDQVSGGRIFGQLKNDVKGNLAMATSHAGRLGQYDEYTNKDLFAWVTVAGHRICGDCDGMSGKISTYSDWESEGLPGSGWSVCKGYCYCVLDPSGKVSNKVKGANVKEKGASIRPTPSKTVPYNPLAFNSAGKHKTVKDSIAWMEANIADKVTLTKLKDIDIANELTATLADIFQTYKLKKLKIIDGRASGNTWASANGGTLSLNKKTLSRKGLDSYYQNTTVNFKRRIQDELDLAIKYQKEQPGHHAYYQRYIDKYNKKLASIDEAGYYRGNVLIEGDELRSIVTHELGHSLHDQYSGMLNASMFRNPSVVGEMAVQFNDRWIDVFNLCKASKGRTVYLRQGSKYYEPTGLGNIGNISQYASSDNMELFAEAFSMYNSIEKTALPDIIVKYFDDYLEALGVYF